MLGRGEAEQTAALAALQHLRHQQHEVLLFHILETAPPKPILTSPSGPIFSKTSKPAQEIKLQPSQVREQYRAAMSRFEHELALRCGQYKIDFVPVDVREPFEKVLYAYLVKRGKAK